MECTASSIRELSSEEAALVGGAFSWADLGQAMIVGGVTGAMTGSITAAGAPMGAVAGALIGGAAYCLNDLLNVCF